ncbi:MAG TPA: metallo-mystery pair system four-Cys motif protein [Leptospiraceae bacterium]|nr:metallo-mystery pair system four-Cys motif protein [Leptospiraceae bacterium]HMX32986.1 metallo-mystery pair system four-Cys motif protein [Leptospiraceae bacterium]HMY33245.1 metallo-mystery pair system four-Cys motif protein [Leptospiraceae bacterium]HMZ65751.1 metallo-mystery pair system four-Cys motif protein [Leptospiraceae bacterium]HNA07577.1 metallo-mystery pair system four-Cys motif protein [Leptospiraceae bacterium]
MKYVITISIILISLSCNKFAANNNEDKNKNIAAATILLNQRKSTAASVSSINFNVVSGTTNVSCSGSIAGTIAGATNAKLVDLKFYVHDIKLISSDGSKVDFSITTDNKWQMAAGSNAFGSYPGVALLDFEDATGNCSSGTTETNKTIYGTSAVGNYVGVEFKVGVPFYLNHMNVSTAASPLNISAMYWAWASGYKFAKIEFLANSNTNMFHLGSGSCSGNSTGPVNPCGLPNRPTISLTKTSGGFDATRDTITLDLNTLYNGADASGTGITNCMAGNGIAACQPIITNIGITVSTGASSGLQTAFSLK